MILQASERKNEEWFFSRFIMREERFAPSVTTIERSPLSVNLFLKKLFLKLFVSEKNK